MLFFARGKKFCCIMANNFEEPEAFLSRVVFFDLSLVHDLDKPDQADHEQRDEHSREQNQFHRRNSSSFVSCRILLLMLLKFPFRRFLDWQTLHFDSFQDIETASASECDLR